MLSAEKENVYVSWDYSTPGISFSLVPGRITIFKNTLEALGYPEYYRFLFDTENRRFAVQVCEIDDEGAHRLPETFLHDHYAMARLCGYDSFAYVDDNPEARCQPVIGPLAFLPTYKKDYTDAIVAFGNNANRLLQTNVSTIYRRFCFY